MGLAADSVAASPTSGTLPGGRGTLVDDKLVATGLSAALSAIFKASVEFSESILKLKVNRLISFDVNALSQVFAHHPNIQLSTINWKTLDRFDSRRNQIDIKAWVFPFYETYHDPVMWVDAFVAELNTIVGIEMVQLQKEPLNRQLSQTLSINSKMGNVDALPFTVTLRVKDVESK